MENLETQNGTEHPKSELVISTDSINYLNQTRKWTMFFSILGFIFIGIMAIAMFGFLIARIFAGSLSSFEGPGMIGYLWIIYLIIGVLYFYPVFYLLKFSINMKRALERFNTSDLTVAFQNLKSHMKFVGILTIVLLAIYLLVIIGAIFLGFSTMFMH